jgi:D-alanyl-lipoteichoic acid acyltransferase DltB (MBOAT superfamily)
MYHLLYQSVTLHFVFLGFVRFSAQTRIISLNSVNKLIAVMVKRGVLFKVRAEFLSTVCSVTTRL